jgi:hypothetical protein
MNQEYSDTIYSYLQESVVVFKDSLLEILRDKPSIPGTIGGLDYQQFAVTQVFYHLVEMQQSILTDVGVHSDERMNQIRLWAFQMEQEARRVFNGKYEKLVAEARF